MCSSDLAVGIAVLAVTVLRNVRSGPEFDADPESGGTTAEPLRRDIIKTGAKAPQC